MFGVMVFTFGTRVVPFLVCERNMPIWRDRCFGMEKLRGSLTKTWVNWNLETTPGIFMVITLFGAFVFGGITMAFAAIAYAGLAGTAVAPFAGVAICGPPLVVLVLWVAYRVRWFRMKFPKVQ